MRAACSSNSSYTVLVTGSVGWAAQAPVSRARSSAGSSGVLASPSASAAIASSTARNIAPIRSVCSRVSDQESAVRKMLLTREEMVSGNSVGLSSMPTPSSTRLASTCRKSW